MSKAIDVMIEMFEGLNDREDYLDTLRFFLRYESELIFEEWYSRADFNEIVRELIIELAKLYSEE